MANYNPFDEREIEKKRDQNWFQKVAIKGAFLVGTSVGVYGFYKSGPARKLLEKYADIRLNNIFAKEIDKAGDNFDAILNQKVQGIKDEVLTDIAAAWEVDPGKDPWKFLNTDASVVQSVNEMERTMTEALDLDVNLYMSDHNVKKVGQKLPEAEYIYLNKKGAGNPAKTILRRVSLTGQEAEHFAKLRQGVILEYLQKYGPNTEASLGDVLQDEMIDAGQYFSGEEYLTGTALKDEKYGSKIVRRIEAVHNEYMKDKKYAELYRKRLATLHKRYMLNSYTRGKTLGNRSSIPYTAENYKRILYGNLADSPFKRGAGIIPMADEVLNLIDSSKESNYKLRKVTSSSRSRGKTGIHPIDRPSSFDYTGQIKKLADNLKRYTENPQDTGLKDFKIDIETFGSGAQETRYLNIILQHADEKFADPIEISIPLATDGKVAGSSPSSTKRLDRTSMVGNMYGQRQDLERYMNSTQMILHEVIAALDGSMMSGLGSFRDKPSHFRKRIRDLIIRQVTQLPLVNGNINDLVLMNSFADPVQQALVLGKGSKASSMRRQLGNFVQTVDVMKKVHTMSKGGRKVAVISFDLESLSNKKSGIQWQSDPNTQFVKAGITVHDYNNGNKLLQFDEVNSSHGYHFFDRKDNRAAGSGFNETLNDLINHLVLPEGVNGVGKDLTAKQAYKQFIDQEIAAGRMSGNIQDNYEFFDIVGKKLKNLIAQLKSKQGGNFDDVIIVTKNGWEFDLRALERYNSTIFNELKRNVVDVQNTRYAKKVGLHQDISLKIEKTLVTMLGRAGISEVQINKYGANMSTPQGVKKMLKLIAKSQRKVGGEHFNFLTINNKMIRQLEHKGLLTRGHVSPVLDALFTSALFREDMADLMNGDSLYDAAQPIANILKTRPHERTPDDLMAIARYNQNRSIDGIGVISQRMMSQGAAANLVYSLVSPEDLYGLSGDPTNRQLNQMFNSQLQVAPSKKWLSGYSTKDLGRRRALTKKFTPLITTNIHDAAADSFRLPKAEDAASYFSHSLNMKTLLLWDANGGQEGFMHVKDQALNDVRFLREMSVPLSDVTNSDPILNDQIMKFYKEQERIAIDLAGGAGNVRQHHREAAAKTLAASQDYMIDFDSAVLSANKYGGNITVNGKKMGGKILMVTEELNKNNPRSSIPQMMAKIQVEINGANLMEVGSAQARSAFGKNVMQRVKTFSDGMAYGIPEGYDAVAHAQFLKKGFVGSAKNVFMHSLIGDIYDVLNDPKADDKVKARYKAVLKDITSQLNATSDPENYSFRINRPHGPKAAKGPVDSFYEMAGSMDVRLSQILEWKGRLGDGHVWSEEMIKSMNDQGLNVQNLIETYSSALDKHIKTVEKEITSGSDAYKHLSQQNKNTVLEELNAAKQLFSINAGSAKMMIPVKQQDGSWQLGISGTTPITIYGFQGREARPAEAAFRVDYLLGLKNSPHLSKSSIDYIRRHTYADRQIEYQSAKKTYRNFLNAMIGKKLAQGKPLSLEKLDFLIQRLKQVELEGASDRVAKGEDFSANTRGSLVQAQLEREQLLETQEVLTNPLLREQIEDEMTEIMSLIDTKDGNDLLSAMRRSDRFFTSTEVDNFSKLAKQNNGILTFNLSGSGNDPYTIDLDALLKNDGARLAGAKNRDINVLGQKLKEKIIQLEENARKYNSKHPKSEHYNPMFKMTEDGKIQLRTISIAWDPFPMNEFNYLGGDLALATPEARIKMDLMRAVKEYSDVLTTNTPSDIRTAKDKLDEEVFRFFTVGLSTDVGSKFWLAGQYNPKHVWASHYGMDTIQSRAVFAKADGRLKRQFSGKYNVDSILDNLTRSSLNTVAITESMFNKFSTVLPTGEVQNVNKAMDKKIKDLYMPGKNVTKSYRPMPGGIMYRYPIPQAGNDGMLDINYLVIPDEVGSHLGMDGNTFYAHTILSGLQGWDNDGDQGALHLKEIGTISTLDQYAKESRQSLQSILQKPQIADVIKRTKMSLDAEGNIVRTLKIGPMAQVIGHTGDGMKAMVSILNEDGIVETKMAATNLLDFTDSVKQISDIAAGLAQQTSKGLSADYARRALEEANYAFSSKSLIPFATNIVKKRAMGIVASVGNVKNARALYDFIGDLSHGLAGISQDSISIGKHGAEHAARLANAQAYLVNPIGNKQFKDDAMKVWKEQFKGYLNQEHNDYLEETFKIATGEIENVERLTRLSQEFRSHNNSISDFMMGRTNSFVLDFLATEIDQQFNIGSRNSIPETSVFRELGDNFKKRFRLDVSDVATFRKVGKGAAIGAAIYLGTSLFRPFGNSKSLNPLDMVIDLGYDADGNPNAINSELELDRSVPIDMVDASFSKQAFIKLNRAGENERKGMSSVVSSLIENAVNSRPNNMYEFRTKTNITYSNYTMNINSLGSSNLDRKSRML